jgi:hypothetical protein
LSKTEDVGDDELGEMARYAHRSGESRGDIEEAIYGNVHRSVGMEPNLKNWSIRRANEILKKSGVPWFGSD